MKRRGFIRSIAAGFAAAVMPWRKAKALPAAVPVAKRSIPLLFHQTACQPSRFAHMAYPLVRRVNYGLIAANLIQVEPLPERAKPIYMRKDNGE